jgi:hypothetical protein
MSIFLELVKEVTKKKLDAYIVQSEMLDKDWTQIGRNLELSAKKREIAQKLQAEIAAFQSDADDVSTQVALNKIFMQHKTFSLQANVGLGGSEGELEDSINYLQEWQERLLVKLGENALVNIVRDAHPLFVFRYHMAVYLSQKIQDTLDEAKAMYSRMVTAVKVITGLASVPVEKELVIREQLDQCQKALAEDVKEDNPEAVKRCVLRALEAVAGGNMGVVESHAASASISIPLGYLGNYTLFPGVKGQPRPGFLSECVKKARAEIGPATLVTERGAQPAAAAAFTLQ